MILRDALDTWEKEHREKHGESPVDYVLLDCPPSLGLLSVNGLVAACEAVIAVQTEFFALQGMTKLVEVVQLLRRRLNPKLEITGFLPCLYDNRTKLAREVIAELRAHFPGRVCTRAVAKNVKLAEAPSYGKTIFEYAPESSGATDYELIALEVIAQEARDAELSARYPSPPRAALTVPKPAPKPTSKPKRETKPAPPAETLADVLLTPAAKPAPATQTEPAVSTSDVSTSAAVDELPELPPDSVLLEDQLRN